MATNKNATEGTGNMILHVKETSVTLSLELTDILLGSRNSCTDISFLILSAASSCTTDMHTLGKIWLKRRAP